ncbi:FMN-binding protein MioC [Muribacter muris]|uniref:FMN-binding protein MioC n=1 Tax=Muribacter muris TaxID=67855 RepID=A0A4Y9JPR4_9PAST|nr:FMN-binding protein MioC [Muribacter muris]MBF0786274.1 FMN-binding protein MioC [Muribacter muris]MBF0827773.1 FMN-binding protein MioC [Muribacter muris]TFV07282.1 FMN-binding protein MioC [Muribacter muris]
MTQSICIITGSTLGGAEYVADHLSDVLNAKGYQVDVFNNAELNDIQSRPHLIVITSTHGAGELPDNIQPLFDKIAEQSPDFSTLKFGVIGLGSSDYDTFCYAVDIVETALKAQGATQVCDSLRIDVTQNFDHDGSAEAWLPSFIEHIK